MSVPASGSYQNASRSRATAAMAGFALLIVFVSANQHVGLAGLAFAAAAAAVAVRNHAGYCRHFEDRLRQMRADGVAPLSISPIIVDDYLSWCQRHEEDPAEAGARARYAAHVASQDRAIPWPPNQRDNCWCGSGESYGACCGQLRSV